MSGERNGVSCLEEAEVLLVEAGFVVSHESLRKSRAHRSTYFRFPGRIGLFRLSRHRSTYRSPRRGHRKPSQKPVLRKARGRTVKETHVAICLIIRGVPPVEKMPEIVGRAIKFYMENSLPTEDSPEACARRKGRGTSASRLCADANTGR